MENQINVMSDNINEIASALSKAQSEIKGAIKDSANPFFKSRYADLESVWEAIRAPLAKNNLSVTQLILGHDLVTILSHSSGQWFKSIAPILSKDDTAQGVGAGVTYMRRFALSAIVGVCPTDDDGNVASGRPVQAQPHQQVQGAKPQGNAVQQAQSFVNKVQETKRF